MPDLNQLLLILHFIGLALGFSATVVNTVLPGVMAGAEAAEVRGLGRLRPVMASVGGAGLLVLWVTGLLLLSLKWGGFRAMPWQFHVKFTAVVGLTLGVGMAHALQARLRRGDAAAASRLPVVGRLILVMSLTAVTFAVLTFS